LSRDAGDLDIINVKQFNIPLLGKWIWRLNSNKGGLWREVIEYKYEGWRSLKEQRARNNKASLWWRDLEVIGMGREVQRLL